MDEHNWKTSHGCLLVVIVISSDYMLEGLMIGLHILLGFVSSILGFAEAF